MKCPTCGHELEEGHLICEVCGTEITMVPEYDPAVENDIEGILTKIKREIYGDDSSQAAGAEKPEYSKKIIILKRMLLLLAACAFIIGLAVIIASAIVGQGLGYRLSKTKEMLDSGDYLKAVTYIERTCNDYPESKEARILLAEAYYKSGDTDREETTLLNLLGSGGLDADEREKTEDMLVSLYVEREDYEAAAALLSDCTDAVRDMYEEYLADKPVIDVPGGDYSTAINIVISYIGNGKVYYTTDGERPGVETGTLYTDPFVLRPGEHRVQAVYVNEHGVVSKEASAEFNISGVFVEAPEVTPQSGTYYQPQVIKAGVEGEDLTIYYTTNGDDPTENDQMYTSAVEMPAGNTNFSFIAIDSEGNKSEAVKRSYTLWISANMTEDMALATLRARLVQVGYMSDSTGFRTGTAGRLVYEKNGPVRATNGLDYYTFTEYIENVGGARVSTGVTMGVEAITGGCALMFETGSGFSASHF